MNLPEELLRITERNITNIPFEGADVDKQKLVEESETLIIGLFKGLLTFSHQHFTLTDKGYRDKRRHNEVFYSRQEVIDEFLMSVQNKK